MCIFKKACPAVTGDILSDNHLIVLMVKYHIILVVSLQVTPTICLILPGKMPKIAVADAGDK